MKRKNMMEKTKIDLSIDILCWLMVQPIEQTSNKCDLNSVKFNS